MRSTRLLLLGLSALAASLAGGCGPSCPTGKTVCFNFCTDTQTDAQNCGACGVFCPSGQTCQAGKCAVPCATGFSACGSSCFDFMNDPSHCGGCSTVCPDGQTCQGGMCGVVCGGGTTACGAGCANLMTDPEHCGTCDTACPTGEVCLAGACSLTCGGGLVKCGSACSNPMTDPMNCGTCGTMCPSGQVCASGSCAQQCQPGTKLCSGLCVNPLTDNANCGKCGVACAAGTVCSAGTCQAQCQPGLSLCNGACANTQTDPMHCGDCGTACAGGHLCMSGACVPTCAPPTVACGANCSDVRYDPDNCGGCGKACAPVYQGTRACFSSACVIGACSTGFRDCNGKIADGCETAIGSDPNNCGACGLVCPNLYANTSTAGCTNGKCGVGSCVAGFGDCDGNSSNGCESNLNFDAANCTRCGQACPSGQGCVSGTCTTILPGTVLATGGQAAQIDQWIGTPGQVWSRCYRMTVDGTATSTYHQKCDGRGPTVSLVSLNAGTSNARLVGAYENSALAPGACTCQADAADFLFSLTNNFKHVRSGNGCTCDQVSCPSYGVSLGCGRDFSTAESSSTMGVSTSCNLGNDYICRPGASVCSTDFCGVNPPVVSEIEVWVKLGM